MKVLLTPKDIAERCGISYRNSLLLIKSGNHIQIQNRYFISQTAFEKLINPETPILIEEEKDK